MKETFNKIIKMFTSDVTFISSRSSTERTLDCRSSWAQCRNSIKASAPSFKEPPLHSTPFFMSGWHHYNNHTLEPFHELNLDSQRVNKLASKLHILSVDYAAKLVYNRRAHSSTVINSHQEPVSGQACNPLDPHWFFISFSRRRSFTVLGTKVALFPYFMWGVVFTACVVFLFFSFLSTLTPTPIPI